MQIVAEPAVMLALFNLGGGEIILGLALLLILFGAKKLPELPRGLGRGLIAFRGEAKKVMDELDGAAGGAGRSLGGIYGKGAAQAITPDNHVAELYDPAVVQNERPPQKPCSGVMKIVTKAWSWIRCLLPAIQGTA